MGSSYTARCKACGEVFTASSGGGFNFQLLHCDTCGKERARPLTPDLQPAPDYDDSGCGCGGRFTFDASPRCPKCRSAELEDLGNYVDYD